MPDYRHWYQQQWQDAPPAHKSLGQHFIYDFAILEKIAQSANIQSADTIFEIGPGMGGLTAAILEQGAKKLYAVEKDRNLAERLQRLQTLSEGRLTIINQDARDYKMACDAQPNIIIANLPYNVGTHLLSGFLDRAQDFSEMVLMFQREVGCRLVARPHSGEYGRLSVLAQARAEIKTVMVLPPGAFRPAPKIASSVIKFTMRDLPELDYENLKKLTALLFSQRRKKIQTVLKKSGIMLEQWHDAPIDGSLRPEAISPQDFITLTDWVKKHASNRF